MLPSRIVQMSVFLNISFIFLQFQLCTAYVFRVSALSSLSNSVH